MYLCNRHINLAFLCVLCATNLFAQQRSVEQLDGADPSLEVTRKFALEVFLGAPNFDSANQPISDFYAERRFSSECRSVPDIRKEVSEILSPEKFTDLGGIERVPRYTFEAVRDVQTKAGKDTPSSRDVAIFFFNVAKSTGFDCAFIFGVFARREMGGHTASLSEAKDLHLNIDAILQSIETRIKRPVQACSGGGSIDPAVSAFLASRSTKDPMYQSTLAKAHVVLTGATPARGAAASGFEFLILDLSAPPPKELYRFNIPTCAVTTKGVRRATIFCREDFIREIETVVRSFENPPAERFTTQGQFEFARQMRDHPQQLFDHFRGSQFSQDERGQSDEHISKHLLLALVFLGGHELGHINHCDEGYAFSTPAVADINGEQEAVVKMCRHFESFSNMSFHLNGADAVADQGGPAAEVAEALRFKNHEWEDAIKERFRAEQVADDYAVESVLGFLRGLPRADGDYDLSKHMMVETLTTLGIYFWHKELGAFLSQTCLSNELSALTICLGASATNYLKAESMFGRDHRNILLRSFSVNRAIVGELSGYYDLPEGKRTIWTTADELRRIPDSEALKRFWYSADLQRFFLQSGLMDTPIKIALGGCAAGWIKRVRKTPLVYINTYYGIEDEMQRLTRIP